MTSAKVRGEMDWDGDSLLAGKNGIDFTALNTICSSSFTDKEENVKKVTRWSIPRAIEWYSKLPEWIIGCNFLPSTAINQIEMWHSDTYDAETIEREMVMAEKLGFNTLRVYLHDLVWSNDPSGFEHRIDHFLGLASSHNFYVILVLFDDCHRPDPHYGTQPLPIPRVHNSGWKHSPGQKIVLQFHENTVSVRDKQRLQEYVTAVLTRFSKDRRVLMWDIYNEPGQSGNGAKSFNLLKLTWDWAQRVRPSQPLTSCLDGSISSQNWDLNAEKSDIITFHTYQGGLLEKTILRHKKTYLGRPVVCTEYMAREMGTTFKFSLPIFKRHGVGCVSWGLVAGKSQTHFNWESVQRLDALRSAGQKLRASDPIPEPSQWFHDIFRMDGSAYDPSEVIFIKAMVGKRSLPLFPPSSSSSASPRTQELAVVAEPDREAAFRDSNNLYALEHIGKAGAGAGVGVASQKRKGVYSDSPAAAGSAGTPDGGGGDSDAAARASAEELGRTILNMLRGPAKVGSGIQEQPAAASIVPIKSKRFDRGEHSPYSPGNGVGNGNGIGSSVPPASSTQAQDGATAESQGDLAAARELLVLLLQMKQGALEGSQVAEAVGAVAAAGDSLAAEVVAAAASERRDAATDAFSGLLQRQLWTTLRQLLLQAGPHRTELVEAISQQLLATSMDAARSLADESLGAALSKSLAPLLEGLRPALQKQLQLVRSGLSTTTSSASAQQQLKDLHQQQVRVTQGQTALRGELSELRRSVRRMENSMQSALGRGHGGD